MKIGDSVLLPCGAELELIDLETPNYKGDRVQGKEPYIFAQLRLHGEAAGTEYEDNRHVDLSTVDITIQRRSLPQLIEMLQGLQRQLAG